MDLTSLREKTRERSNSLWGIDLDYAGLLTPIQSLESLYNELRGSLAEVSLEISDGEWQVKETSRDRLAEIDLFSVVQDKEIADLKVALGYDKLAIAKAVGEYKLAVQEFAARVKEALMAVREFAAALDLENLEVDGDRMQLEIDKEVLRQERVRIGIQEELINQKMVEADIARHQVEAAKAETRAVLAQIQVAETEVRVIEAEVNVVLAEVQKVELAARVASILAEIARNGLAAVRLVAETEELEDRMTVVGLKKTAELSLQEEKYLTQLIILAGEEEILRLLPELTATQLALERLVVKDAESDERVLDYKWQVVKQSIDQEEDIVEDLTDARIAVQNRRRISTITRENAETVARVLLNAARRWAAKNMKHTAVSKHDERLEIGEG